MNIPQINIDLMRIVGNGLDATPGTHLRSVNFSYSNGVDINLSDEIAFAWFAGYSQLITFYAIAIANYETLMKQQAQMQAMPSVRSDAYREKLDAAVQQDKKNAEAVAKSDKEKKDDE